MKTCSMIGLAAMLATGAFAQGRGNQQRPGGQPPAAQTQPDPQPAQVRRGPPAEERSSVTHHKSHVGGQEISYTATAATYVIKADDGTPKASIFFVAYTKDDVPTLRKRPLSFVYNGGPGSASLFTHMGLGPKRIVLTDDGHGMPAPYSIVDNEDSFLDATDMVFIDAVSTGYSRPAPGENPSQFYGVVQDATMVLRFHLSIRDAQRALGVAEISDRRKLRHHALGAAFERPAAAPSDVSERRRADLVGRIRQLGRGRSHQVLPAHHRRIGLVSPAAAAGSCRS